ncbi:glycosyl transferase family 2 [Cellulophaga algicola DSM 14237]|uniref:Glycosyl transferase family 2 n=1 Tax=Cellulophaga algicola (strain DSM 14237 / IC166 / ACAM 630) TaxID=688270 RepID=E6X7U4_CELAD|nr:TIGR04283 family arsenosugar biosynthesis glycosyltransferase [Cellulophaga algicola]ADV47537.1 glycosyl transferase family 2 [Cellulophaga algicola DSM 14237]
MISIIIPAHNEQKNLLKLIPYLEVLCQETPAEVLVVLSAANTETISISSDKIKVLECQKNGRAVQMNYGAQNAKGTILAFLHADVLPPKSFLKDIEKVAKLNYQAGFFSYRFDSKSILLRINAKFTANDGIFTGGGDQCLFIEKEVFNQLGKFDAKQLIMEDFEFFKRMKKNNISYKIINNDLLVSARKYESNSYLRVNISNLLLVLLFKMGYPSNKLRSLHNRLLKMPYHIKVE